MQGNSFEKFKQRQIQKTANNAPLSNQQVSLTQLHARLQRLEDSHNSFARNIQHENHRLKIDVNTAKNDLGGLTDIVNSLIETIIILGFNGDEFLRYCKKNIGDFTSLDSDVKINCLMEYLNAKKFNNQAFDNLTAKYFDQRNELVDLVENEQPFMKCVAMIMWSFTHNGVVICGQNKPSAYVIGSNTLIVDQEMLAMKTGETKTFEVTFPNDYAEKSIAGKSGQLTISIYRFKKQIRGQANFIGTSEEEKKKAWKEKFQAKTIE